jgi:hypothetical protein
VRDASKSVEESRTARRRPFAVDVTLFAVELGLDVLWRWQNATYKARSASSRQLHRWAQRHGL